MTTGTPHQSPSRRPRRSPSRRFAPLGVVAWAVLEVWLLALVGEAAGGLAVLALLAGGAVLGAVVVRRAGRRAWRNLTESLRQGRQPGAASPADADAGSRERRRDATLPLLGGLLLMLPGLVSDVAGLLCLFPPTAALLRRSAERSLTRRLGAAGSGTLGEAFHRARMHGPDGRVVPGEVVREEGRAGDGPPPDGPPAPPLTR